MNVMKLSTITVYADISCPFCFALHERLLALQLLDNIDWRTIEHIPGANANSGDARQISQLNEQYRLILKRAEDVPVRNPGFVPNTSLVNRYLCWVAGCHPDQLVAVRTAIYRALWQHGMDISEPRVLDDILAHFAIVDVDVDANAAMEEKLARWQCKWQFADFEMRIPVMQRNKSEVMLGLQHISSIRAFVSSKSLDVDSAGDICQFIAKDVVKVLIAADKPDFSPLRADEHLMLDYYHSFNSILQEIDKKQVDLLLLDANMPESFAVCQQVRDYGGEFKHLPIIFYTTTASRDLEAKALSAGANDFISLSSQHMVLLQRVRLFVGVKHQLDVLSDHAAHDGLTGLYNKREFEHYLEREWRLACRYKTSLGILMLDIDYFKAYNDNYGHVAGDEVLVKVANCMAKSVYRGTDLAARYGGEEFVIVLPDTSEKSLKTVAKRIQKAIAALNIEHCHAVNGDKLTASIGLSLTPAHADNNYLMLIECADQCLYRAKNKGRNAIEFHYLAAPQY